MVLTTPPGSAPLTRAAAHRVRLAALVLAVLAAAVLALLLTRASEAPVRAPAGTGLHAVSAVATVGPGEPCRRSRGTGPC
jgi:hypothetical protein